jgi:hypothetical protein
MLKTVLAAAVIALSLTTSALAGPGQPPAPKWTIMTVIGGMSGSLMTTYGTYNSRSACLSSLKSIVTRNPYLRESDGVTPINWYDTTPTVMCITGVGGVVMDTIAPN